MAHAEHIEWREHVEGNIDELREQLAPYNIAARLCGFQPGCVVIFEDKRSRDRRREERRYTWPVTNKHTWAEAAPELELTADELLREHRGW